MSKQSDAKAAQQYTKDSPKCGNCKHYTCDMTMPAWMVEQNKDMPDKWGKEYEQPKNKRCGLGGFAIVTTGHCQQHERGQA